MPTAEEKKKLRIKRKAVQTRVIPRNVRAKKGGATIPEGQSGKSEKHVTTSKGPEAEKDQNVEVPKVPEVQTQSIPEVEVQKKGGAEVRVSTPSPPPKNPEVAESSKPKKTVLPDLFEGFPNIQEKEKAEAEHDELKKQLEELSKRFSDLHVKNKKLNEINQTLNQLLSELHEASTNEFKAMKLEMEAVRADKTVKDEQLNMLYTVIEQHLGINVQSIYNNLEIQRVEEQRAQREKDLAEDATKKKKELIVETQEAGGSSSQADVEMVDAEVDPKGFVLVGDSTPLSYNFDDIIRLVKVEQRKRKVKEPKVLLLRWKEEEKVVEEEEEVDEELEDMLDAVDNYDPSWDDFIDKEDDDDQGSTGLLIVNPSVQQKIDDFLNDEINEQEEDQHQESSSSGKQHADQVFLTQPTVIFLNAPFKGELEVPRSRAEMLEELGLGDGKFKFDIEDEILSSPEKEYEFKYAHEADNYNDVIVEDGSDSSEDDTVFHYSGVDETFPTLAEMFKEQNEEEIRRKIVEKITTEGIPQTVPRETLAKERKKWFKMMPKERKYRRLLQYFT
ncbi:glutamic acid-rich protein-like [Helianthus annuus]|uniref:glutamic acid-rich protein-like n=1 Tax=Helianthus annuus TaxID=4232 RepID=UPI000B907BF1|nr:glutamic acid-rich protein-like [Helianthus annuus]